MNLLSWLYIALSIAGQVKASSITSNVTIDAGTIHGRPRNSADIVEYLGIPFASPPVGSLRWKPPQQISKLNGTVNATAFGPSCFNAQMPGGPFGGTTPAGPVSEDCLSINVWTGARDSTEKRPVMVWIYGGGFQFGSSAQPNYNGTNLANEGVILVSFNYRMGVLGFLGLSELDQEGTKSGNFGLQDQLAALQWVQNNIEKFGGDPENVTIFGESAGAHSVGLILASPKASGLFNRAILESGAFWDSEHGSIQNFTEARDRGDQFRRKLGASSLAQLRALPAATVNSAALWNSSTDPGLTAFAPNIDNYVVPAAPGTVFGEGKALQVPILAGFNADEEALFLARTLPHDTPMQYVSSTKELFGPNANESLHLYPGSSESQANQSASALDGDLIIREQTFEALDWQTSVNKQKCFGYYFTYTSAYSPRAAHTAEVDFVFGNLGPNPVLGGTPDPSDADQQMSKTMRSYWTNFAKTGDPNGNDLPRWPHYAQGGANFLELGRNASAISTPNMKRFQFLRSLRKNGVLPPSWRNEFTAN